MYMHNPGSCGMKGQYLTYSNSLSEGGKARCPSNPILDACSLGKAQAIGSRAALSLGSNRPAWPSAGWPMGLLASPTGSTVELTTWFTGSRNLSPAGCRSMGARLTRVVQPEEQWAGDGEGQDPYNGNHDSDSALGAVACVVEHGHSHSRVPVRVTKARNLKCKSSSTRPPPSHPGLGWTTSMPPESYCFPKILNSSL